MPFNCHTYTYKLKRYKVFHIVLFIAQLKVIATYSLPSANGLTLHTVKLVFENWTEWLLMKHKNCPFQKSCLQILFTHRLCGYLYFIYIMFPLSVNAMQQKTFFAFFFYTCELVVFLFVCLLLVFFLAKYDVLNQNIINVNHVDPIRRWMWGVQFFSLSAITHLWWNPTSKSFG